MLVATHLESNMCTKDIEFHLAILTLLIPKMTIPTKCILNLDINLVKEKKAKVMLFGLAIKLATVSFKPNPHLACNHEVFIQFHDALGSSVKNYPG
jgi:hypothetical protein